MPHEKRYANTGISQIFSDTLLHECNWDGVKCKKTFLTLRSLNEILSLIFVMYGLVHGSRT